MRAKLTLLLLFACAALAHYANTGSPSKELEGRYREANSLFYSANPTDASDSRALVLYDAIIQSLEKNTAAKDTMLFFAYLRKGVLLEVKEDPAAARQSYLKALAYKKQLPQLTDSVLYNVYLYAGATCYHLNNYDSARQFFDKAEMLLQQYPGLPDRERLYNSLGALYYESGDYHQAKTYFTKALQYTQETRPKETASIVNFQINIAACYTHLERYIEALSIYHQLIRQKQFSNQIYQKLGIVYLALGDDYRALHYFAKADPNKVTGVKNEMAYAYIQLKDYRTAALYLDESLADQQRRGQVNRVDEGINHLYRAEMFLQQNKVAEALNYLQQAIISFSRNFSDKNIYANPGNFAGSFASFRLFDALSKKAAAFRRLKDIAKGSLPTSEAAISLLRYIERSYETDDARLFLKKNAQQVYKGAFNDCMQLLQLTKDKNYLEKAFMLTEQNKASVLAVNVNEKDIKRKQGIPESMLQKERNLRFALARLNIKSDAANTTEQEAIAAEKVEYEIQLSNLTGQYEKTSDYYNLKYRHAPMKLIELQKSLRDNQALISFYADDSTLNAFVVKNGSFDYVNLGAFGAISKQVMQFVQQLKFLENGKRYGGARLAANLYSVLVKPLLKTAGEANEWIIIPDGILNYLPFEALQESENGKYLLESKIISYHFSAELLRLSQERQHRYNEYQVLAFAPFADVKSYGGQSLPSSKEEIAQLPGRQLLDSAATRTAFMEQANKYPVVHLATHAVSNTNDPGSSYISFFAADPGSGNLYLEELYGVNMDSTALVIISACESGDGQLVNSEGVISLSRGFAYAGCKSMVTSLWKANDRSTAIITRKFHEYLQKGYSRSEALQKAKLYYIEKEDVHRAPNYWAHLILIGDTEPLAGTRNKKSWLWILGAFAVITPIVLVRMKKKSTHS